MEYWKQFREEVEIPTTSLLGTNENITFGVENISQHWGC